MIALLQRVTHASVSVSENIIGEIDQGILVLLGIEKNDDEAKAQRLVERILNYRLFCDSEDKMNLSVRDINGGVLCVSQFTLAADTNKGNRPSFTSAAAPELGRTLYNVVIELLKENHNKLAQGEFGADMQITLTNDGPVTFWLQV